MSAVGTEQKIEGILEEEKQGDFVLEMDQITTPYFSSNSKQKTILVLFPCVMKTPWSR